MKKVSARVNIFQCAFYILIGVTGSSVSTLHLTLRICALARHACRHFCQHTRSGYFSFLDRTRSDILENYDPTDRVVDGLLCILLCMFGALISITAAVALVHSFPPSPLELPSLTLRRTTW